MMSIGSGEKNFQSICENNIFLIPPEQREYVWDDVNVTTLLDDLYEHFVSLDDAVYNDEEDNKYIGAIIALVEKVQNSANNYRYVIYDGQQRITTLLILMYSLVNFVKESIKDIEALGDSHNEEHQETIKTINLYLSDFEKVFVQKTQVLSGKGCSSYDKITPHYDYEVEFFNQITAGNLPKKHKDNKLSAAYYACLDFLNNNFENCPLSACHFGKSVLNTTEFTVVTRHSPETARKVFLSLNSTGKSLESIDLFRGYLVSNDLNSLSDVDELRRKWSYIFKNFNGNMRAYSQFIEGYVNTLIPNTRVKMARGMGKETSHISYDGIYQACFSKGNEIIRSNANDTKGEKFIFETPMECMNDLEKYFEVNKKLKKAEYSNIEDNISLYALLVRPNNAYVPPIYASIYATLNNKFPEHIDKLSDLMGRYIILVRTERGEKRSNPAYMHKFEAIRNNVLSGNYNLRDVVENLSNAETANKVIIDEKIFDSNTHSLNAAISRKLVSLIYVLTQNRFNYPVYDIQAKSQYHVEHCSPKSHKLSHRNRMGNLLILEADLNTSAKDHDLSTKLPYYRKSDLILTQMMCPGKANDILKISNSTEYERILAHIYNDVYRNPIDLNSSWSVKDIDLREKFYAKVLQEHLRHIKKEALEILTIK